MVYVVCCRISFYWLAISGVCVHARQREKRQCSKRLQVQSVLNDAIENTAQVFEPKKMTADDEIKTFINVLIDQNGINRPISMTYKGYQIDCMPCRCQRYDCFGVEFKIEKI